MIKAEEAYKKVMKSLVDLSDIESKINNAIENKKFEIDLDFRGCNFDKIYKIIVDHFTPLGYKISRAYSIRNNISWDLE
jgi:hypothetical protein